MVGDKLICHIAAQIACSLRGSDIAVRYGGDEFVILLNNTSAEQADVVAQRIRSKLAIMPLQFGKHDIICTISLGIATYPNDGAAPDSLLQKADATMYFSKIHGKNRVHAYAEIALA